MGIEKPISVGHFTFDAELANMDHVRLHQGVPDGGESLLGDEPDKVVTLQVDEAVTPSQVNTPDIDPVKQVSGVIRQVPQMQGKMIVGVEGVRYVEDDPLAGFLGCLACLFPKVLKDRQTSRYGRTLVLSLWTHPLALTYALGCRTGELSSR